MNNSLAEKRQVENKGWRKPSKYEYNHKEPGERLYSPSPNPTPNSPPCTPVRVVLGTRSSGIDEVDRAGVAADCQVARQAVAQLGGVARHADHGDALRLEEGSQGGIDHRVGPSEGFDQKYYPNVTAYWVGEANLTGRTSNQIIA